MHPYLKLALIVLAVGAALYFAGVIALGPTAEKILPS